MKLSLEILTVAGDARALGLAQGEALAPRIHAFIEQRLAAIQAYAKDRGTVNIDALFDIGREAQELYAQWDPTGYAEHRGIAEGAQVDAALLYTLSNMTDLRDALLHAGPPPAGWRPEMNRAAENAAAADAEGCTSVLIPPSRVPGGHPLAGQTWDLNPPDVDFIVAIHRKPTDNQPQTFSVTCAGCLSLMGLNEHGVALGTTNLKTWNARPGLGYLSLIHRALRAQSATEAAELIRSAPRAGAHSYWIADAQRQLELECGPLDAFERTTEAGPLWRTNHCIAPALVEAQAEATSESSRRRFARFGQVLQGSAPVDVALLQATFKDRSDGIYSINRYAEDRQGTATNAVFIADSANRTAWACRGNPDRGEWIEFQFT